ncbi:MAG: transglycosylase SLT domain-containing protein [Burkholderiaceae bacterium]
MPPVSHSLRCAVIVATGLVLSSCATNPPEEPNNICSIFEEKRAWYLAAKKAEARWGTPIHVGMAIVHQESSFQHDARPPRRRLLGFIPWKRPSSAYGYAQALDGTWERYLKATGDSWRDRDDFEDAIDFVHWHMRQSINQNAVDQNDARAMYLNYHEGLAGFRKKSYRKKPWLASVARRVQVRASRYQQQYAQCRDSLKPSLLERLFRG